MKLVGILNVTPDSFSDGGLYDDAEKAINHAEQLFEDEASLVDIGAESTNPWSSPLSSDQEWQRLEPVLQTLLPQYGPNSFSLDTYHPQTIARAAEIGKFIVNDITSFRNPEMAAIAAELGLTCIVSHLPLVVHGNIQAAHHDIPLIEDINQVYDELQTQKQKLIAAGIEKANIILDPGIGFGKTPELNRELLEFAKFVPESDVMIGYSRKRFLGEHRMELAPNLEAARIAIAALQPKQTLYLRVHDVAGHRQLLSVTAAVPHPVAE